MAWWLRKSKIGILSLIATGLVTLQPNSRNVYPTSWITITLAAPDSANQDHSDVRLPTPGERIERVLSSGETHSYQIPLNAGQYLHANIEPSGIDAGGAIYGPNGQHFLEFHCRQRGRSPVSFIADVSGNYRLEIRSLEEEAAGRYMLTAESVRSGTAQDKTRVAAEIAFDQGERLRAEWREDSSRKAIEKYESALTLWKSIREQKEEANTLRTLGDVWQSLNESRNALRCYAAALLLSQKTNDRQSESEIISSIGYVYFSLGKTRQALESGVRALKLGQESNNRYGEAQAFDLIGEAHYATGNMQKALVSYQQALSIWHNLNDRRGQALALLHSGYAYSDLSNSRKALDSYIQAMRFWQSDKNRWGQAHTLTAMGHLQSKLGEKQEALRSYREARELFLPMGERVGEGFILNGMGYVYDELGESQKALESYTQALGLFQEANYQEGKAGSLYKIGKVYFSLGNNVEALNYYQHSRSVSRAMADKRTEAVPVGLMGQVYLSLGDKKKALRYYNQALLLHRSGGDLREEAYTLNSIGRTYESLGSKQNALDYYNKALSLNRATGDRFGESSTLYGLAHVQRDLGNLTEARAQVEAALETAESLRTAVASQELRGSYFASVRQNYELNIDVLMQLHGKQPSSGFDVAAFNVSERARARSLLETLNESHSDIRQGVDSELLERERSLRQQLNVRAERQMQLGTGGHRDGDADALATEISKLAAEYDEVQGQIKASSPHYAALMQPQPLDLNEIQQQVLGGDSLLLEYALGDERSYLWAVTSTEVTTYQLPGRAEIETAAREVHSSLIANQPLPDETFEQRQARVAKASEQLPSQIANLGRILLEPVAGKLGTKRLLIVPDGALQYIPFQILTTESSGRPLVVDHEIVNEPSASTLALLVTETKTRKTASRSVAVLADPVFEADDPRIASAAKPLATSMTAQVQETELHRAVRDVNLSEGGNHIPRLLASRAEADAIMSVTPWRSGFQAVGFAASRATAMRTDLGDYRIVHFATHGLLNNEHPELSGIVLSLFDQKGQPQDGFLRLHDIYNLKLPVDLVVLSACNTGLGKDVKGEGLIGLTRGFMYAGASSVVASLWKVDDEATAELMRLFYGYMLRDGLSPAAALRKAQVTMSQQKRWQSPYYWAGFVIQGQYLPKEKTNHFPIPRLALWFFGVVVVSAVAFYALKRRRKITL